MSVLRPDIMRWIPDRWDQFIGNYRIIRHFQRLVRKLRRMVAQNQIVDVNRLCFLLTGPSRSGKTALVKFLVRCVICKEFNEQTLNPCTHKCSICRQHVELCGLEGIFAESDAYDSDGKETLPLHFTIVDCTMIHTPGDLREHLFKLCDVYNGIRIFYFDEVHRLVPRGMDEMLLKTVEEAEAIWLFSTAKPEELESMFKNRLLKLQTELPTTEEMAKWLVERCDEWAIPWQPKAVIRVIEKSNRVVGTALHALALAALHDDEGLSHGLVDDWDP